MERASNKLNGKGKDGSVGEHYLGNLEGDSIIFTRISLRKELDELCRTELKVWLRKIDVCHVLEKL